MKGFFPDTDLVRKKPLPILAECGACKLYKGCRHPYMPVSGKGKKGILVVGEAPGKNEDEQNRQFVGNSGQLLREVLRRHGIKLREDCWITNAVICRPTKNKMIPRAVDHCRPNLVRTIKELQPDKVLVLGAHAVRGMLGWLWKGEVTGIKRWAGAQIPCTNPNTWICPTYHPSDLLKERDDKNDSKNDILELCFEHHLEQFSKLKGKPWQGEVPDYAKQVLVRLDSDRVVPLLRSMVDRSVPIAFDFETDRLKPDIDGAAIVCCGVSDGTTTVAFPWNGTAVGAMKELLASDVPKIGYNIHFEQRWARKQGLKINNWFWDGMLEAHALDSRGGTKNLEYQSFVLLGKEPYKDFSSYMKTKNGNQRNRLHEVGWSKLLRYCGTDALLEWLVAHKQMEKLNRGKTT